MNQRKLSPIVKKFKEIYVQNAIMDISLIVMESVNKLTHYVLHSILAMELVLLVIKVMRSEEIHVNQPKLTRIVRNSKETPVSNVMEDILLLVVHVRELILYVNNLILQMVFVFLVGEVTILSKEIV